LNPDNFSVISCKLWSVYVVWVVGIQGSVWAPFRLSDTFVRESHT
jgi:hypothetical protein